jgi:hypothetical protein
MRQWRTPFIVLRKARGASQPVQLVETLLGAHAVVLTCCYAILLDMPPAHMGLSCSR